MARNAAFDLLIEMARGCKENYLELQKLLLRHHISGKGCAVFVKLQHRWPQICHDITCSCAALIHQGQLLPLSRIRQIWIISYNKTTVLELHKVYTTCNFNKETWWEIMLSWVVSYRW